MFKYIMKRLGLALIILLGVSLIIYILARSMPVDYVKLKISQLNAAVMRSHNEKEPSIIADYAYTLAQVFSSFYNAAPIMTAESNDIAQSRLALSKLVRDILVKLLYLLGIESPEVMLKKSM